MNLILHPEEVLHEDLTKACSEGWPLAGLDLRELSEGVREGEIWPEVLGRMTPLEPDELWIKPYS